MARKKIVRNLEMTDGRESGEALPHEYSDNPRLRLERSLNSISQLMDAFSEIGNEPLNGLLANGLAAAISILANESQGLYSYEEAMLLAEKQRNLGTDGQ